MELVDLVSVAGDLTTNVVLLLVLWQGLKRFDKLLELVITLAARTNLSPQEVEDLKKRVGINGGK